MVPLPAKAHTFSSSVAQRVLYTYIVECRVSIVAITLMSWEIIPQSSTYDIYIYIYIYISCITLRTLKYGKYGIFLVRGNAGCMSSTVVHRGRNQCDSCVPL